MGMGAISLIQSIKAINRFQLCPYMSTIRGKIKMNNDNCQNLKINGNGDIIKYGIVYIYGGTYGLLWTFWGKSR